ncbi:MAG: excinuclease ABC subunit UvrA [Candidatus Amesbacteria bacterium]|nr:excinuclease ABC subunit UvrA [Candidatus Amesbacteria bacterium]
MDKISIKGAREHNLKNITVEIPRNKLTSIIGVSGSGKSTLAFDILFAEGQRQYLESLGTFTARNLQRTERPDVDEIKGLSSTVMIEQKQIGKSARSTVGTVTEIYTYLRLLFSRIGSVKNLSASHFSFNNILGACKSCRGLGIEITVDPNSVVDFTKSLNEGAGYETTFRPGGRYFNILKTTDRLDFDTPIKDYSKADLDFLLYSPQIKLKNDSQGFVQSYSWEGMINHIIRQSKDLRGISRTKAKKSKKTWIINSCSLCKGSRLNELVSSSTIRNKNIGYYANLPLTQLISKIKEIDSREAEAIVIRMTELIQGVIDVGIGYLSLNRSIETLSGGEAQRIKLARELGSDLIELIYILDEPTAGLHPKDVSNMIKTLKNLRDSQNTVIVVEHDPTVILESDHIIEIGPKAGKYGGELIFSGTPNEIVKSTMSVTGKYLSKENICTYTKSRRKPTGFLSIEHATLHNLKDISVNIPKGVFVAVTGVSGSGKSSLINDIFVKKYSDQVIFVDQSQVGGMVRGYIATYCGAFDYIRDVFAKENRVNKNLFSSNSKGGCSDCKGLGFETINMHFMADVKMVCETCNGKKYIPEVLAYKYKGKNIHEVLEMTSEEASSFFDDDQITKRLDMLTEVGLGYLNLGQTLDTLSGGESQRLKLASNLHKKGEFYVLDEPTSGLHPSDIEKLLKLLKRLVDSGNSVLVIEHNLDVIRNADWIIDLGPDGGDAGGQIVALGTPEDVAKVARSYTGQYLC